MARMAPQTMTHLKSIHFAAFFLLAARVALAQGIGWLDLTDTNPRLPIRPPGLGGGECGGGAGYEPAISAKVTLTYLDRTTYSLGDVVTYELKIQNTGKEPIDIPWTPHLADLVPADPSEPYPYLEAVFSLKFTNPVSARSFSLYSDSYGSPNVAGTIRKLPPGESLFVRGRHPIDLYDEEWPRKIAESSPLNVKVTANLTLDSATYTPGKTTDTGREHSKCIPISTTLGVPLEAALLPLSPK